MRLTFCLLAVPVYKLTSASYKPSSLMLFFLILLIIFFSFFQKQLEIHRGSAKPDSDSPDGFTLLIDQFFNRTIAIISTNKDQQMRVSHRSFHTHHGPLKV